MGMKLLRAAVTLVMATALSACSTLSYYAQSVRGHLDLLEREQPIEDLLADDGLKDTDLRRRLATIQRIRDFASAELGLPDNQSYRRYADLDRPYVVWSVIAAPEFSLEPVTWCFLFAGCVGYRGYFDLADARAFAAERQAAGEDVYVGGVPAYSTLGWLDDPLPSTVIHWSQRHIAGLIFHELAHQVVYVDDDSAFNEAFATTVQRAGVRRWLRRHGDERELQEYEDELRAEAMFLSYLAALRSDLAGLYRSDRTVDEKRQEKARMLASFAARWGEFHAAAGPEADRYAAWFEAPVNNARLASVALYHELVPGFEALLRQGDGDMAAFYGQVRSLAEAARPARRLTLMAAVPSP